MDVPSDFVVRIRAICLDLPDAYEEEAWAGIRWRVRTKTFAHVLAIDEGWPPAYARASRLDGPALVLMFRSSGQELGVLRDTGMPFFAPPWRADEVGLVLGTESAGSASIDVDWTEVGELVTESYCVVAPKSLGDRVDRPPS
jgi:hypothetical protein